MFLGKFGQRDNLTKTSIINDPEELFQLVTNPCVDVNGLQEVNSEVLLVNWNYKTEAIEPLPTTNVVIASYVTGQARLLLYTFLDQLQERALYCDTGVHFYKLK